MYTSQISFASRFVARSIIPFAATKWRTAIRSFSGMWRTSFGGAIETYDYFLNKIPSMDLSCCYDDVPIPLGFISWRI